MKPSVLALFFALLGLAPAQAQQVGMPPPAGTEAVLCAYNTSPPSLTTGNVGFLQCDNLGKLLTSQAGASATFGAAFPATGTPPGFTISGLFQPWNGLTSGGVNYGLVGVVDNTGTQLNGYTTGTAGVASTQVLTIQGIPSMTPVATNQTQIGGAALALGQTTKSASLPVTIASDQGATPVVLTSQYPNGAVPLTATATGTTLATVATLAGTAGKTTYICGFTITADATALATGTAVVSGTISGSLSYLQTILAAANGTSDLTKNFNPCIPASVANTAVVVTSAAAGVGGNTIVNAQGYQL